VNSYSCRGLVNDEYIFLNDSVKRFLHDKYNLYLLIDQTEGRYIEVPMTDILPRYDN